MLIVWDFNFGTKLLQHQCNGSIKNLSVATVTSTRCEVYILMGRPFDKDPSDFIEVFSITFGETILGEHLYQFNPHHTSITIVGCLVSPDTKWIVTGEIHKEKKDHRVRNDQMVIIWRPDPELVSHKIPTTIYICLYKFPLFWSLKKYIIIILIVVTCHI